MKFYEFCNTYPFYVLIGAETLAEAQSKYVSDICELDSEKMYATPTELTEIETIKKIETAYSEDGVDYDDFLDEFQESITVSNEPYIILIDKELI